jgi:hypothetical protein
MAEERNVGLARATADTSLDDRTRGNTTNATDDTAELSKEELQRRMEEARESITQTVSEIKDTVTSQYQTVRESISDAFDWREQYRRHPVALSAGALGAGLLAGYGLRSMLGGGGEEDIPEGYEEYDYDEDVALSRSAARAYSAQAITGSSPSPRMPTSAPSVEPPPSSAIYADETSATEEDTGPGLFERFKGTQAYDRLMQEVSTLGARAVDELSHTAQTVVLPALLGKLKDAIGIDLSMQKQQAERSRIEREASSAHAEAIQSGAKQQEAHEQAG